MNRYLRILNILPLAGGTRMRRNPPRKGVYTPDFDIRLYSCSVYSLSGAMMSKLKGKIEQATAPPTFLEKVATPRGPSLVDLFSPSESDEATMGPQAPV